METLFVLKKKFRSSRVVRNIYEFTDERKYWLNQYRYVINNGICNRGGKYLYSVGNSEKRGVKTFRLLIPGIPEGNLYRYSGLHYYMHETREQWVNDRKVLRVPPRYAYNFYLDWETRCGAS